MTNELNALQLFQTAISTAHGTRQADRIHVSAAYNGETHISAYSGSIGVDIEATTEQLNELNHLVEKGVLEAESHTFTGSLCGISTTFRISAAIRAAVAAQA